MPRLLPSSSSSSSTTLRLSTPSSYLIPLLHAAKHPHSTVVGVLVGEKDKAGGNPSTVVATHAFPLFHTPQTAVGWDVALALVEQVCEDEGKTIVGLYVADDCESTTSPSDEGDGGDDDFDLNEESVPAVVGKVARTLRKGGCPVVVINNEKLASEGDVPFSLRNGKVAADGHAAWARTLTDKLKAGTAAGVWDVDDALEDVSRDWRNPQLVS